MTKTKKTKKTNKLKAVKAATTPEEEPLVVPEKERLLYSQAAAIKAMFDAQVRELDARYQLLLAKLDTEGRLAAINHELRQHMQAANEQGEKVTALTKEIGETLGIDFSQYIMDAETGVLTKREDVAEPGDSSEG